MTRPACRERLGALAGVLVGALVSGCGPGAPQGAHTSQLDALVAQAVGDPATCVLVADAASGKVVYRYGSSFNCDRQLPACDSATTLSATAALKFAAQPGGRLASCASVPDGSRQVGWAEGAAPSKSGRFLYSAVMEGQRALPGHEINARLYDAFQAGGL